MTAPLDMKGFAFHVGCKIVQGVGDGFIQICTVTRLENEKNISRQQQSSNQISSAIINH